MGGRLPLLRPSDLDPAQAQARDRLVGPFSAYLHVPAIFQALRDWMSAIQEYGLPGDVQQVAILTVGAAWRSAYEVYAHAAEEPVTPASPPPPMEP